MEANKSCVSRFIVVHAGRHIGWYYWARMPLSMKAVIDHFARQKLLALMLLAFFSDW
jgi:hypothetical protein